MEDKTLTPTMTKLAPGDIVNVDADGNITKIKIRPKLSVIDKVLVTLRLKKQSAPKVAGVYSATGTIVDHTDKAIRVKLSGTSDSEVIGKILEANKNRTNVVAEVKKVV
jgi:hypothetical protein